MKKEIILNNTFEIWTDPTPLMGYPIPVYTQMQNIQNLIEPNINVNGEASEKENRILATFILYNYRTD